MLSAERIRAKAREETLAVPVPSLLTEWFDTRFFPPDNVARLNWGFSWVSQLSVSPTRANQRPTDWPTKAT